MTQASPSSPSLLRRPGCWLTFAAAIPLLIGIAWVVEDWAGRRHLEKTKARLAAEGFEFDTDRLLPHPVPDEENFCAIPLLRAIGRGEEVDPEVKKVWEWLQPAKQSGKESTPLLQQLFNPDNRKPTDWAAAYADLMTLDPAMFGDTAPADPLRALDVLVEQTAAASFAELEQAMDRPQAQWLPPLREALSREDIFSYSVPWFNQSRQLAAALSLRWHLAVATADHERAGRTWKILQRLTEASEQHGTLVSLLIGTSIKALAIRSLWGAAAERSLPAEAWRQLAATLPGASPRPALRQALMLDADASELALKYFQQDPATSSSRPAHDLFKLLPNGWYSFNAAHFQARLWEMAQALDRSSVLDRLSDEYPEALPEFSHASFLRREYYTVNFIPVYYSSAHSILTTETVSHMAAITCALEIHYHEHQIYPPSLDQLVPHFLPAVPADFDGKPLRYALTPHNGRYKLWSVGLNGMDEGGTLSPAQQQKPLHQDTADLVWEYP